MQTFSVDSDWRRRRVGMRLQERALAVAADSGCHQIRSWSSRDNWANYRLKLAMGFGFHPAYQETPDGECIPGGYFVRPV